MTGPLLLETKLHVPRRRAGLVPRPRLDERLRRAGDARLTLVSAPAGFGKTTLLTEWLADGSADRAVAWLSLDTRDNDPALFWTSLLTAIGRAVPGVGADALTLLQTSSATTDVVLSTLLNDLHRLERDVVVVLDDLHVVEAREVQDGIASLVEHLPPQAHLVIASRADPALPLARLRARGELVEVRAADLRFRPDEAAAYLRDVMDLALTPDDVAALADRTEGWIAALQLAGLSLQGRDDVGAFVAAFAGDDRFVVDYLVEEVLQRQPEDVRRFLLRTSVLSRLSGPLCDAVTGQDGGQARLEALDRANLLVVPLDDRRRWYRYHHLFGDLLQARLAAEHPDEVPDLHRRASEWLERDGDAPEAIRHALAAGDPHRAADLLELAVAALRQGRQEATLRRLLEALPDDVVRVRPVLAVAHAGVLLLHGLLDGVEAHLRDAERWLDPAGEPGPGAPAAGMVVVDHDAFRALPGEVAVYRAALAQVAGDDAAAVTFARRALDLVGDGDDLARGAAAGLLALTHWRAGELGAASTWWSESREGLERAGFLADVAGVSIALGDLCLAQGRLGDALAVYEHGLAVVLAQAGPVPRGAGDMHVGLSQVLLERGDLDGARRHLAASRDLGDAAGLPQNRYRWRVATARVREVDGDLAGAVELLDEAQRVYVGDMFPEVRPVPAVRARVLLRQGRVADVLAWARERGLTADDELTYLREYEHVTLARALVAHGRASSDRQALDRADALLERLRQAAEAGQRTGTVLEVLVLQALVRQARGDVRGALDPLRRALAIAEPEGYVRVFADEGAPLAALLRALDARGVASGQVRRLLAACDSGDAGSDDADDTGAPVRARGGPVEPLSPRELDVLRLLAGDLDGPEIARELVVSLNTMRTHTRNIYAKLGVTSRRAAVRRAQELGLLARRRDV